MDGRVNTNDENSPASFIALDDRFERTTPVPLSLPWEVNIQQRVDDSSKHSLLSTKISPTIHLGDTKHHSTRLSYHKHVPISIQLLYCHEPIKRKVSEIPGRDDTGTTPVRE